MDDEDDESQQRPPQRRRVSSGVLTRSNTIVDPTLVPLSPPNDQDAFVVDVCGERTPDATMAAAQGL